MTRSAGLALVLTAFVGLASIGARIGALGRQTTEVSHAAFSTPIPYLDAKPILERLKSSLPPELASKTTAELESAWPDWVLRRNADIRARVERGDEDSIINLLLFGTSFTRQPRALNDSARLGGPQRAAEIVRERIEDMVDAVASPGGNERLRVVRDLVARRGIDPATRSGKDQLRLYLRSLMKRVVDDVESYARTIQSARAQTDGTAEFIARSTLFRARGLSSDTSIRPDFAIDQALDAIASKGLLGGGAVQRVAVIGPGLDFTDKAEGYDFYPQQTTQPFSIVDSLLRQRLARADALRVTTLDLSARINGHLQSARRRAGAGDPYVLVLPRDRDLPWRRDLLEFWKAFGGGIGEEIKAVSSPPESARVDVRAVRVRRDVVLMIDSRDVNVVLERLAPLAADERFDLVVSTNVFVYYDLFEQALAVANVASMLRPGGLLLSNNALPMLPTTPMQLAGTSTTIYSDRPDDRDNIVWYQRR